MAKLSKPLCDIDGLNDHIWIVSTKNIITIASKSKDLQYNGVSVIDSIIITTLRVLITQIFSDMDVFLQTIFNEENINYIYEREVLSDNDSLEDTVEVLKSNNALEAQPFFDKDFPFIWTVFIAQQKCKMAQITALTILLESGMFESLLDVSEDNGSIVPLYLVGIVNAMMDLLAYYKYDYNSEDDKEFNLERFQLPSKNYSYENLVIFVLLFN